MPLYEYRCTQCGNRYEKIQSFSSELETVCPKCGGKVERPLTAPALQFKGAGWYINDYASKPSGGSSSNDKPAVETTSTESKSSDAKPTASQSKSTANDSSSTSPPSSTSSN